MNILNIVLLLLGSVLLVLFIVLLSTGKKYDYMLESLEGDDYPLKFIYGVGFTIQESTFGQLQGVLGDRIRKEMTLYHGKKYSEYYARVLWAQVLSFGLLLPAICFVIASMASGTMSLFFVAIGVVAAVLAVYYFLTLVKGRLKTRRDECDMEFPNAISKLALLVNSGVILHNAWEMVAEGKGGTFYELMRHGCEDMRNGMADVDAIYEFGIASGSDDIKKFVTALIQSVERGGGELSTFLVNQSAELWAAKRQLLLQKGEKAASALLMPITMMFAGVLLIVVAAALQSFSF